MRDNNFLTENNARYLWHPTAHPADSLANAPTIITQAKGVKIIDIDGHETIDAVAGLWNVNLGYSCQPIKDAITAQLEALPYYSGFYGSSNDKAIEFSYMLHNFFAPDGLTRAFFTSGGSDSVDTALRLARQYHKIRGESGRFKFFSLQKGYHGSHFGGASVNGNVNFRTQYEPMLTGCYHIPAPYGYRNPFHESDPKKLAQACLHLLESEIAMQGAETIAAFIMEPVLGAGGVIPPDQSFMPGVRDLCTRNGILLIADEVVTAFGRTGSWTGSRHWGVQPDMVTLAKAITSGYFPFGATMFNDQIAEVFEKDETEKGLVSHGYTYSGHPVGAAAAIACLHETEHLQVDKNAKARGTQLFSGLQALVKKHEIIGDVRGGHGLMCGIELVSNRETKQTVDKSVALNLHQAIYRQGVTVRPSGPNIILSPPLIITASEIETVIDAIDKGLTAL